MKDEVKTCLDCKHCFVEDLYGEFCCGHPKHRKFHLPKEQFCEDFEHENGK